MQIVYKKLDKTVTLLMTKMGVQLLEVRAQLVFQVKNALFA